MQSGLPYSSISLLAMENERDKEGLVSSFLEIAFGETATTAKHYLQAASWNLDEAIQLFYVGNEAGGGRDSTSSSALPQYNITPTGWDDDEEDSDDEDSLYDDTTGPGQDSTWESNSRTGPHSHPHDTSLASLFRPPLALMFDGDFHSAKVKGAMEDKWLLLNLQSPKEFSSHMLNRDTWSNEVVQQAIRSTFVFWQADQETEQGLKVCTYYKLVSIPAILVINPITGQKMHQWTGMVQPERLLEGLVPYMESGPIPKNKNHDEMALCAISRRDENTSTAGDDESKDTQSGSNRKLVYLPLPQEPKGNNELLCRIKIRLPDGQTLQRAFLSTDPIKLLWSFCCTQLDEGESRPFYFILAIPGASKRLEYESNLTLAESHLSNSMVTLVWL